MYEKPFSQACENNKTPILDVLTRVFARVADVVEIGSGTGQHAVYFAEHLPHLKWHPTDREENIKGIAAWLQGYPGENLSNVKTFDIRDDHWPIANCDGVFSANTAHIMAWPLTQLMIQKVGKNLKAGGVFALYGPLNYQGMYTSESNKSFDQWLKDADPERGIRNFEEVNAVAENAGLSLLEDNSMPANNRLLVWEKKDK